MKECPRCLFTEAEAEIGNQCEYCDLHDELEKQAKHHDWPAELAKIQAQNKVHKCLIGISGGLDSSIMLYLAVKKWNLNPLVIHFDNGWNAPEANNNIDVLVRMLNVNFIRYHIAQWEYDDVCRQFLLAGVPDADIPNDMAMAYFMYKTAEDEGIKYIFNGHNFRTEGSSPRAWSYMDAKYLCSVYGMKPVNFPLQTFWMQLRCHLKGIKQARPLYYAKFDEAEIVSELKSWGWQDYGGKHCENIYTEFVGSYLLPRKFGIDKRRTYASALIRSGEVCKSFYRLDPEISGIDLKSYPDFKEEKMIAIEDRIGVLMDDIMAEAPQSRDTYKKYNFKKYKLLLWVLMKLGFIPLTFYRKYTK